MKRCMLNYREAEGACDYLYACVNDSSLSIYSYVLRVTVKRIPILGATYLSVWYAPDAGCEEIDAWIAYGPDAEPLAEWALISVMDISMNDLTNGMMNTPPDCWDTYVLYGVGMGVLLEQERLIQAGMRERDVRSA